MHIVFVDSNPAALEALRCAKEMGHRVSFIQSHTPVYPSDERTRALLSHADLCVDGVATTDAVAVAAALKECHAAHPVDVVTTQFDMAVEAVALACRATGLAGPAPEAVLTARRKDRCRAALRDAGVPSAWFATAATVDEALAAARAHGYPVVVKPPSGSDSALSCVAYDEARARAACERILHPDGAVPGLWQEQFARGILVEEFLDGPLVSVEIGVRDGAFYAFCVSGRTRSGDDQVVELGAHIPEALTEAERAECVAYVEAVCRAVGLDDGIFHVELIRTARGPVLVEVNPRIMGGVMPTLYRHATGRSVYEGFLHLIGGAPVPVPAPTRGVAMSRRLLARHAGVLPRQLDTGWLREYGAALVRYDDFAQAGLGPGSEVAAGAALGRVIVLASDHAVATGLVREIVARFESMLGLSLVPGEHDPVRTAAPTLPVPGGAPKTGTHRPIVGDSPSTV